MNMKTLAEQYRRTLEISKALNADPLIDAVQATSLNIHPYDPIVASNLVYNLTGLQKALTESLEWFGEALTEQADGIILDHPWGDHVDDSEVLDNGDVSYTLTNGEAVIVSEGRVTHFSE